MSASRRHRIRISATAAAIAAGFLAISTLLPGMNDSSETGGTVSMRPSARPSSLPTLEVVPWLDVTPQPSVEPSAEPTLDPASVAVCTAADLAMSASGWGGATGSMAGGAILINMSIDPCRIGGKPVVELLSKDGRLVAVSSRPKAVPGPAVVLGSGQATGVITVWMNWCGAAPARPLWLRLEIPDDGGSLESKVWERPGGGSLPRCDVPKAPSTIGVPVPFRPLEPSLGGYEPDRCTATQLRGYLGSWGAAAGTSYANVVLLNVGGFDCILPISPALELREADGRLLATGEPWADPASTLVLPAGSTALTTVGFANWCMAPPRLPFRFDVLIGSSRLKLRPTSDRSTIGPPACNSPGLTPPPTLGFSGPLVNTVTPQPAETDPTDTLPLHAEISALPDVRRGDMLVYVVTLTNVSPDAKAIDLGPPCPTYTERLFLPSVRQSVDEVLVLNCAGLGALPPDGSRSFEMHLPIPLDSPLGTATLIWELGDRGPGVKKGFAITP